VHCKKVTFSCPALALAVILNVPLAKADTFTWKNVKIGGGGGFVPNVIYNTTQPGLVYARTDMGGLYRRDSVSGKWIPLTDWVAPEDWNMLGGEAFATDPVDPKICYFAAGTYTNDWADMNGRILRSKDYGSTWQAFEMPFKFGGNMPGRGMGERLAIDPNSDNILYFGVRSGNGLWKSEIPAKPGQKFHRFR
jgi:xyloglucan-specific exo-beta-1,4-glucanase